MLYKLATGIDKMEFETLVVSLTKGGAVEGMLLAAGIPLVSLEFRRSFSDLAEVVRLVRLLRGYRPDILQTWLYHADLLGLVAGKLAGVPVIGWNVRCSNMELAQYSLATRLIVRLLARLSRYPSFAVVNSSTGRRFHQERLGYVPKRWCYIPNGFDLVRFRPDQAARAAFRTELGLGDDTVAIGLVARYDPMKDHANFLMAAGALHKRHPGIQFVMAGKGVTRANETLCRLIDEHGLAGCVHCLGERADVARILAGMDIVSLTSAFGEGFPNILGEAMACGIPCVSTDVGDAAEIIGDTGMVVAPRDHQALARAWRQLIEIGTESRRALGLAARRRIEQRYGLSVVVGQYESLYQELGAACAA